MIADTINLLPLISYIKDDPDGNALHASSSEGRTFGKLVVDTCKSINEDPGFYIWGKYEKNGLWRTIYLGKAGSGKTTSLRARITEELKNERAFLWCDEKLGVERDKEIKKIWENHYINTFNSVKAQNHIKRSIRKQNTSHIIWVTTPDLDNDRVLTIESDLIETLNPIANVQRPQPCGSLQSYTINVIKNFKEQIHVNRDAKL